jgi:hypothetical protein
MEPIFAESASETVTAELRAQLDAAVAALPPAHRLAPTENELSDSREAAYTRLQDWAFTKGFAFVTESAKTHKGQVVRAYLECVHHKKGTRNTRKLTKEERQRIQTKTQANGCKFSIGIYYTKAARCWRIRSKNLLHNHAPNPDPFQYKVHQDKIPGWVAALAAASSHRGVIGYKDSAAILKKSGLPDLGKQRYYNLQQKEGKGTLTRQEELELILEILEEEDVHVRIRAEYTTDSNGDRNGRVIKDLFWMSPEQIKMARRFVSGFMYKTDATFNTNSLKLPLSVMVGIDNCGKTFPVAYCYITSECAASFKFVANQLSDLAFYDCLEAAIIVGDFSKGLGAACAAKAAVDLGLTEITEEPLVYPLDQDKEMPEAAQVVVREELGVPQTVSLQLCEWHAVQAIKKRLVTATVNSRYSDMHGRTSAYHYTAYITEAGD